MARDYHTSGDLKANVALLQTFEALPSEMGSVIEWRSSFTWRSIHSVSAVQQIELLYTQREINLLTSANGRDFE